MGSCVSIDKDPKSATNNNRFSVGSTKNEDILIPSPVKEKPLTNGNGLISDVAVKTPTTYTSFGSKDDIFFDSQPWLESDCEDDFYSVNGDFTPSRGNTPVHHSFSLPERKLTVPEKSPVMLQELSPKKRLSDLFKDSLREHLNSTDQDGSVTETPYVSGANSTDYRAERTPYETSVRSMQCCLPRLRSIRSFSERKKKLNPRHSVG